MTPDKDSTIIDADGRTRVVDLSSPQPPIAPQAPLGPQPSFGPQGTPGVPVPPPVPFSAPIARKKKKNVAAAVGGGVAVGLGAAGAVIGLTSAGLPDEDAKGASNTHADADDEVDAATDAADTDITDGVYVVDIEDTNTPDMINPEELPNLPDSPLTSNPEIYGQMSIEAEIDNDGYDAPSGNNYGETSSLDGPSYGTMSTDTLSTVPVAEGVNDSMSFSKAFATARAEVGPGGCFEWHGQVYGTYYENEWNSMSSSERAAFQHEAANSVAFNGGYEDPTPNNNPTAVVDGDIPVAEGVDDSMSFSKAFATARAEVGPGGCFEWHGKVYNTFYENEWNSMTPDERAEFQSHFNNGPREATPNEFDNPVAENDIPAGDVDIMTAEIDGQETFFVDVDRDGVYEYMASDENGDGVITDNEMYDISTSYVTANDIAQMSGSGAIEEGGTYEVEPNVFPEEIDGGEPIDNIEPGIYGEIDEPGTYGELEESEIEGYEPGYGEEFAENNLEGGSDFGDFGEFEDDGLADVDYDDADFGDYDA